MATTAEIKRYMAQAGCSRVEIYAAIHANNEIARQRRQQQELQCKHHAHVVADDAVRITASLSAASARWQANDTNQRTILVRIQAGDGCQGWHDAWHPLEELVRAANQTDNGDGLAPLYRALVRQAARLDLGYDWPSGQNLNVVDQAVHSTSGQLPQWAYWS